MENIRLETVVRDACGISVLGVTGEIDVHTAKEFKEAVDALIGAGQKHVVLDMRQVTYMDSSGFGTLLSATKRVRPRGGSVNLAGCTSAINRIMHITRLDSIFGVFDSVEEACSAVGSDQPEA